MQASLTRRSTAAVIIMFVVLVCSLSAGSTTAKIAPVLGAVDRVTGPFVHLAVSTYAYTLDSSVVELLNYTDTTDILARQQQELVDFATIPGILPSSATLRQVPFGLYGLVLPMSSQPPPSEPYGYGFTPVLSIPTLSKIAVGRIVSWQDPEIADITWADLPQGDIVLLVHDYSYAAAESASETGTFVRALVRHDPDVFGAAYAAHGHLLGATLTALLGDERVVRVAPNVSLVEVAAVTERSLTYATPADVAAARESGTTNTSTLYVADMFSAGGSLFQGPTVAALQATLMAAESQANPQTVDGLALDLSGATDLNTWPFVGLAIALVPQDAGASKCAYVNTLLRLLAWTQTNQAAIGLAKGNTTLAPLTNTLRQRVVESMGLVLCNNNSALATQYVLGVGSDSTAWSNWAQEYDPAGSKINLRFEAKPATEATTSVQARDVDFAGIVISSNSSANVTAVAGVRVLPAGLRAVGCATSSGVTINLSLNQLANIMLGVIVRWNDPALGAPAKAGVGNITVVLDQGGDPKESGGPRGGPVNEALAAARPGLAATVLSASGVIMWPVQKLNSTILAGGNVAETLLSTPNAFGCDFVDNLDITRKLRVANIASALSSSSASSSSSTGTVRGRRDVQAIGAALRNTIARLPDQPADLPRGLPFLAGVTCRGCWPIGAWMGFVVSEGDVFDCERTAIMLDWIWWLASDSASGDSSSASTVTFGSVSDAAWGRVATLRSLATMTCRGQPVFSFHACLSQANTSLCSNHGSCMPSSLSASCSCDAGWEGVLCADPVGTSSQGDDTTTWIVGVAVAVPLAVLLFACVITLIAVAVVLIVLPRWRQRPDWAVAASELQVTEKLGEGANGEVWRGVWRGTQVAVKYLHEDVVRTNAGLTAFHDEVGVCSALRHPNVVLFMGACLARPQPFILFEYMPLGSLWDLLGNELIPELPFLLKLKIVHQASRGMHFLHSSGIVHRDLKSLNLLLDHKWNTKVADFGLTRTVGSPKNALSGNNNRRQVSPMSVHWMAPELFENPESAHASADVYAFGIIMWEVLARDRPYRNLAPQAIPMSVAIDGRRPPIPQQQHEADPSGVLEGPIASYTALMQSAWAHDPEMRPDFSEILATISNMRQLVEGYSSTDGGSSITSSSCSKHPMDSSDYRSATNSSAATSTSGGDFVGVCDAARGAHGNAQHHARGGGDLRVKGWYGADPSGANGLACVVVDVTGANILWEERPHEMARALPEFNRIVREQLAAHGGIESSGMPISADAAEYDGRNKTMRGGAMGATSAGPRKETFVTPPPAVFSLVFGTISAALRWCAATQAALVEHPWDERLLESAAACEETGVDDVLFRGLCARMGVGWGMARRSVDALSNTVCYLGPATEQAVRSCMAAEGGQILVTRTAARRLVRDEQIPQGISFVATRKTRSHYQAVPERLAGRWFGHFTPMTVVDHPTQQGQRMLVSAADRNSKGKKFDLVYRDFNDDDDETDDGGIGDDHDHDHDDDATSDDSDRSYNEEEDDDVKRYNSPAAVGSQLARAARPFLGSTYLCRWFIRWSQLTLGEEVGVGSFGRVYVGEWARSRGQKVAIKLFLNNKRRSDEGLIDLLKEASILSRLQEGTQHNVLVFMGMCIEPEHLCIVTEYMPRGSLRNVLDDRSSKLTWNMRLHMLRHAARGIAFLHAQQPEPVFHRDLKSSNLLVGDDGCVKVCDFGFARTRDEGAAMTRCGTPAWTAPEVFRGETYTDRADVYSFGIIMWEVLTRAHPYADLNFMAVAMDVNEGKRPVVPVDCPRDYRKLMKSCWHRDIAKRPSMEAVLAAVSAMIADKELPV